MQDKANGRRELLRLLALSGFSLFIPSCNREQEIPKESTYTNKLDTTQNIEKDINEILDSENVVFLSKDHPDYNKHRRTYNLRISKYPALIAICNNTDGVAEAIKTANRLGLKVAVKSGGHSLEGYSSIDEGMQIDLSLMDSKQWLPDNSVSFGPACRLMNIYDFMLPKGRLLPAGSCGTVGIAGLTLGGGYGFFSRKYGLTCDHLIGATLVDGLGKIRTVDETDPIMWALKGGGNGNFGIVTEFVFKTRVAPKSFTQHRFKFRRLNSTRTLEILKKYFELAKELPDTCFSAFVLNHRNLLILITNYGKRSNRLKEILAEFEKLSDKSTIGNPKNLAKSLTTYYGRTSPLPFKNASAGYYQGFDSISGFAEDLIQIVFDNPGLIYQINTLGGEINNKNYSSSSCYPHREMPFISELQAYWQNDSKQDQLMRAFAQIQDLSISSGINKHYRNYPDIRLANWGFSYYGKNYEGLQRIKKELDPEDTFHHTQTISLPTTT